jgi:hypothetical protein
MHNTVYAFDADKFYDERKQELPPLWKRSLEPSVQLAEILTTGLVTAARMAPGTSL